MARFLSRRGPVQTRSRRKTSWQSGPKSGTAGASLAFASSGAALGGVGQTSLADGLTLVRLRGNFMIHMESGAIGDEFFGAFGIGIVNSDAFSAGSASVPSPRVDQDWDGWLYHRYLAIQASDTLDTGVSSSLDTLNPTTAALRFEVDSKAMRKVKTKETIFCALELTEVGAASGRWHFDSRMLLKLA